MDGVWTVASQVAWQLVAWPLAVLLIIRSLRRADRRGLLPAAAVAMLLIGQAVSVVALEDATRGSSTSFLLITSTWFIAFPLLCATYPDGRFVPRWLVWPTLAYAGITVVDMAVNGALRSASWWWVIAFSQLLLLFAQVYRYRRRATTGERESVRWAILGIIVEVEAFVLVGIAGSGAIGEGPDLLRGLANAAALPIPVAFAIGLLRPRLANVDAALRLVVGGTMAMGVLAGGYAATTAVARAAGADVTAAGWWGAAAVALLAVPVIRASASLSEWVTYRGRSSPVQAVTRLGAALDEQPDAASVPETVLRTLMEAISLDGAALFGDVVLAARLGDIGPIIEEFPVMYQGERIAILVVPPRRGESELTSRDRQVASRLAIHAAPALHGARALADLKNAHSKLHHTREEERKGLRRDLHDDLSPTLAGLALEAAALSRTAQHVNVELAAMADSLNSDIHAAVAQTREIAYGLRPPILDDKGLVAAIRARLSGQQADHLRVEIQASSEPLVLPAAVDLAALRIVQEAVSNVRKHANAAHCTVALAKRDGELQVTVSDDGIGPPPRIQSGLGLASIQQRATELGGSAVFMSAPRGGMRVAVRLPIPDPAQ